MSVVKKSHLRDERPADRGDTDAEDGEGAAYVEEVDHVGGCEADDQMLGHNTSNSNQR